MSERRLVFSTETGRIKTDPTSDANEVLGDGKVRVRLEKKGRGGKAVTTVTGLPLNEAELKELGKKLKKKAGVGGAVKEGVVEVQGDRVAQVIEWLGAMGYDAKRSGG